MEVSKLVLEGDGYEQGLFDHPFLFLSSIHQSEQVGQCFFGSDAILFVLFMEGKTLEHLDKKHFLHEGFFVIKFNGVTYPFSISTSLNN